MILNLGVGPCSMMLQSFFGRLLTWFLLSHESVRTTSSEMRGDLRCDLRSYRAFVAVIFDLRVSTWLFASIQFDVMTLLLGLARLDMVAQPGTANVKASSRRHRDVDPRSPS